MLSVLTFAIVTFAGILGSVLALGILSASLGILPPKIIDAVVEAIDEAAHNVSAPIGVFNVAPEYWYVRGNVLFQNGTTLDEDRLALQRNQAKIAIALLIARVL